MNVCEEGEKEEQRKGKKKKKGEEEEEKKKEEEEEEEEEAELGGTYILKNSMTTIDFKMTSELIFRTGYLNSNHLGDQGWLP
jgi:hypothetical protein